MKKLVFVYGTLRKEEYYSHYLKGSRCVAEQARVRGRLYDTGNHYPAMVLVDDADSSEFVYGELYEVDRKTLARLDELEGYRDGGTENDYDRITTEVWTDRGKVDALVYVADRSRADFIKSVIESGDWKYEQMKKHREYLYFAYGSCMDNERMKQHNVDHLFQDVVGKGILRNYSLRFTYPAPSDGLGRADIVEEEGGYVEGKVYRISHEALKYLEWREGLKVNAYRPSFVDLELNGKRQNVFTVVVKHKQEEIAPPLEYAREIVRGAATVCSETYVEQVRRRLKVRFGVEV